MSLTKEARAKLPADHFAVPGKRKLPIHDATHTRLAWDMVDRTHDLSPEERSAARAHILRRAKELGMDTADWHAEAALTLEGMAVVLPPVDGHPNRAPFKGVLTRVDQPSDEPPGGALGKRVYIPAAVAEEALDSLANMAVDCDPDGDFDSHDPQFKIGIITAAEVVGDALEISGFIYANDFPELWAKIQREKHRLGFSYECKVRILDMDAEIWMVDRCVFTGAALLYKHAAAYHSTSLAAKAAQDQDMDIKEVLAAVEKLTASVTALSAQSAEQAAALKKLEAGKGASLAGPIVDQVEPHIRACHAAADGMESAGIGTHPTLGHAAMIRRVAAHMLHAAVSGRVPHVFRESSYMGGDGLEAGAESPELKAAKEKNAELEKNLKDLKDQLAGSTTQIADLKAAQAKTAEGAGAGAQPGRKTMSAAAIALLNKYSIKAEGEEAIPVDVVDRALSAAALTPAQRIEAKLKLRAEGAIAA